MRAGSVPAIQLLGPVEVRGPDGLIPVAGIKAKAILAILALEPGRPIGVATIIDRVWGEDPPITARNAVQVYIAGLRRVLREAGATVALQSESLGYRLDPTGLRLDCADFWAHREAGLTALQLGERGRAAAELRVALGCWRGPALTDLTGIPGLANEAVRLDGLERATFEVLAELELDGGGAHRLMPTLTARAERDPLAENLWRLLALARYQSGDQVGALAALRTVRSALRRELGVDPGPALRALEAAVLRHDPGLAPVSSAEAVFPDRTRTVTQSGPPRRGRAPRIRVGGGAWAELTRPSTLLGRDPDCDVVIDDPTVSGRHARLARGEEADVIADLGSRNGTRVNGALVSRATLGAGDVIALGHTVVVYDAGAVDGVRATYTAGSGDEGLPGVVGVEAAAGESAT